MAGLARKGIGTAAGSSLGMVGADLAGYKVGKTVEQKVTKLGEKVFDKDTARQTGETVGNVAKQATSSVTKTVLSTKVGQNLVGEIAGPHPGRAICSFCQGTTEIVLRVLAMIGSLLALIAAGIAFGVAHYDRSLKATTPYVNMEEEFANTTNTMNFTDEFSTGRRDLYGYVGYVLAITGLSILMEVLVIMIRWCNWGCVNLGINIYLTVDIIMSFIFVLGHAAGGGTTIYYFLEYQNTDPSRFPTVTAFQVIRISIAICMGACFLCVILYVILAVWSILFIVCGWNRKVSIETFKEIICSSCTCTCKT